MLGAKVRALADGRFNVSVEDLKAMAAPALRHRIILNFEGEAEGIDIDTLVAQIMESAEAATVAGQRGLPALSEGGPMNESPTLDRLVAQVAAQVRRRRAEHYGLRGAFWRSLAAVAVLLFKQSLGAAALPLAGALFVAGALARARVGLRSSASRRRTRRAWPIAPSVSTIASPRRSSGRAAPTGTPLVDALVADAVARIDKLEPRVGRRAA